MFGYAIVHVLLISTHNITIVTTFISVYGSVTELMFSCCGSFLVNKAVNIVILRNTDIKYNNSFPVGSISYRHIPTMRRNVTSYRMLYVFSKHFIQKEL